MFSSEGEGVVKLKEVQLVYLVELTNLIVGQKIEVSLEQLSIRYVHLIRIHPSRLYDI